MAVSIGLPTPVGKIVIMGAPLVTRVNIETAANCYPGRLVKRGTTDFDVVVCGAEAGAVGWLGYEQADEYRPATPATIYAAGDEAPLLRGSCIIVATLATSQTIVKGDRLVSAAAGMLQKATAIAGVVPGGGGDTTPVTSTSAKPAITMTGDVGVLPVVAFAEETITTTSATAAIRVRSV